MASQKTARGRGQLERVLEVRRGEDEAEFHLVRRGWCLGYQTFRQELKRR